MIGVFDSGIGGLSVLDAIARQLPDQEIVYLADTAHVPYGNKDDAYIRERVRRIGDYLVGRGCRQIVVACNTATAAAAATLRERLPSIGVVGVEPGIKPAVANSRSRHIAVLATESTARSKRLAGLIDRYADGVQVDVLPCPGWASKVETLHLDDPGLTGEARRLLMPALLEGADHVVLGCTHYAFLKPLLEPIVADRAVLVDVADAVARQCRRLTGLSGTGAPFLGTLAGEPTKARLSLAATAHPQRLEQAVAKLGLDALNARLSGPALLADI